jgi:hypothetical protein
VAEQGTPSGGVIPKSLEDAIAQMRAYGQPTSQVALPPNFNPRAAPPQYRGAAPVLSFIASNTDQPVSGYTPEEQAAVYNTPVLGGVARFLNSPRVR